MDDNEFACGTSQEKRPVVVVVDVSRKKVKKSKKKSAMAAALDEEDIDKILQELGRIQPIPAPPPLAELQVWRRRRRKARHKKKLKSRLLLRRRRGERRKEKEKKAAAAAYAVEHDKVAVKKIARHVREMQEQGAIGPSEGSRGEEEERGRRKG